MGSPESSPFSAAKPESEVEAPQLFPDHYLCGCPHQVAVRAYFATSGEHEGDVVFHLAATFSNFVQGGTEQAAEITQQVRALDEYGHGGIADHEVWVDGAGRDFIYAMNRLLNKPLPEEYRTCIPISPTIPE